MDFFNPPKWLVDVLPEAGKDFLMAGGWYAVLALIAVVALVLVSVVLRKFLGAFKRKKPDEDKPLRENLAEYPPPPKAGPRKLLVEGTNGRVRLVVIAPVGKGAQIDADKAAPLLEHVVRGLGGLVAQDKARIKIWKPQLSHEGFSETFFRVVKSPDKEGKASRWVLISGRAKVGEKYILLGLAVLIDEATNLGVVRPRPDGWNSVLKVKG